MQSRAQFAELRTAYDRAFERLCDEVRIGKTRQNDAAHEVVGRQGSQLLQAEEEYRRSRDKLAMYLLDQQQASTDNEKPVCLPA